MDLGVLSRVAEKCSKAGHFFGLGLSTCTDSILVAGAVMAAYGAYMVDEKGNITANSDAMRQVLDWYKRLSKTLPDSVYAYDNASNNKELISGKSALILNAPSAYAVAVRDKPEVAKQLWTFPPPKGPKGRFDPAHISSGASGIFQRTFPRQKVCWRIWQLATSRSSWSRPAPGSTFRRSRASWISRHGKKNQLPKYTIYNFPPRDDVIPHLAGYPAPLQIGTQMWAQAMMMKMIAQHTQAGLSANDAIAWAESELESYMRT